MAQKTGEEDIDFKVPETITLCVNNCGIVGNPATDSMCHKCFAATTSTATTANSTTASPSSSNLIAASSTPMKISGEKSLRCRATCSPDRLRESSYLIRHQPSTDQADSEARTTSEVKRIVGRCAGCRRKLGLTGIRCRCGDLFCSEHRYSDRHDCSYDYKAAGREAVARENPVVKAAKIIRV